MSLLPERSEGGSRIYRYDHVKHEGFVPPPVDGCLEQITDHIEAHIGKPAMVFHELVSEFVHVDVHLVEPTRERPFRSLITSGMSDRPMTVPSNCEQFRFAELMICLPPKWPMSSDAWEDEAHYWPIRLLIRMARFPHEYKTWFGPGHTLPNGNPAVPYAKSTMMNGALIETLIGAPPAFHRLVISEDKVINFFGIYPLYADEMDLKLNLGSAYLMEQFQKHQVTELLDPRRNNVIGPPKKTSKPWWKFF